MRSFRRAVVGAAMMAVAAAVAGYLLGGPVALADAGCPQSFPAGCTIPGCTKDLNQPLLGATCCHDDPTTEGCCTYDQNTIYRCVHADGSDCMCANGKKDSGGTCAHPSIPDTNTVCDMGNCSLTRGQCVAPPPPP